METFRSICNRKEGKGGFNSIRVAGFLSGSFGFKREEGLLYSHAFFRRERWLGGKATIQHRYTLPLFRPRR